MAMATFHCISCGKDFQSQYTPETNYPKVGQRTLSPGKAVVGGLLFGPVGAIAGAAMGDKGKVDPRQSLNSSTRLLETMSRKCPYCGSMSVSKKF